MNLFVSLKYLVALDDHRHFGRAAIACHVTQPALSNALRALEESFGTSIVNRGRSFAGFTEEGERILVSARRILHEHEQLEQDLKSREGRPAGHLTIGAVPTAMPLAARFAAMLQDRHPGILPRLRSLSSTDMETGLESLAIDLGLGYPERMDGSRSPMQLRPQYSEHYYVLRRSADAAQAFRIGEPMTWREASVLPLCLLGAEMHNRTIVDRAFAAVQARPVPAIETNSILALTLSVVAGRVASIMPGALVSTMASYAGLEALPLVEPQVAVEIAFMVHETNRPSRTLAAALEFAQSPEWLTTLGRHAGALSG
jgi:DNA-binding transcriptional LysR family regulator